MAGGGAFEGRRQGMGSATSCRMDLGRSRSPVLSKWADMGAGGGRLSRDQKTEIDACPQGRSIVPFGGGEPVDRARILTHPGHQDADS